MLEAAAKKRGERERGSGTAKEKPGGEEQRGGRRLGLAKRKRQKSEKGGGWMTAGFEQETKRELRVLRPGKKLETWGGLVGGGRKKKQKERG